MWKWRGQGTEAELAEQGARRSGEPRRSRQCRKPGQSGRAEDHQSWQKTTHGGPDGSKDSHGGAENQQGGAEDHHGGADLTLTESTERLTAASAAITG